MDKDMIDRVAEAIHKNNGNNGAKWREVAVKTQFIEQALAAIEASQLPEQLEAATKREAALVDLIQEIRDDLYMRGENDSDGVRVMKIGNGVLYSMDKALANKVNNKQQEGLQ